MFLLKDPWRIPQSIWHLDVIVCDVWGVKQAAEPAVLHSKKRGSTSGYGVPWTAPFNHSRSRKKFLSAIFESAVWARGLKTVRDFFFGEAFWRIPERGISDTHTVAKWFCMVGGGGGPAFESTLCGSWIWMLKNYDLMILPRCWSFPSTVRQASRWCPQEFRTLHSAGKTRYKVGPLPVIKWGETPLLGVRTNPSYPL